jgi:hypothetical protein
MREHVVGCPAHPTYALLAELADLRLDRSRAADILARGDAAARALEGAEAEMAALREAWDGWATHTGDCDKYRNEQAACSCGYDELAARLDAVPR